MGDLDIYLASTKAGALQIGLSIGNPCDCLTYFGKLFPNAILIKDRNLNRSLMLRIKSLLFNRHFAEDIETDIACSCFQWRVLNAIKKIPFGKTKTYKDVASLIGRPKAARAVGQALH